MLLSTLNLGILTTIKVKKNQFDTQISNMLCWKGGVS